MCLAVVRHLAHQLVKTDSLVRALRVRTRLSTRCTLDCILAGFLGFHQVGFLNADVDGFDVWEGTFEGIVLLAKKRLSVGISHIG